MPDLLSVGSLFTGFGGIDLGLEQTGRFQIAWQVEINPYCQSVLAKHWPDVTRFRDVQECGKHNLPSVAVLAGGFPCQDISHAGKRGGYKGHEAGYGRTFCDSFVNYDPHTCSWKTSQLCVSLSEREEESSDLPHYQDYLETWPASGTMRSGKCSRRRPLVPHMYAAGSLLWPTPTATDYKRYSRNHAFFQKRRKKNYLPNIIALQPGGQTPMGFYGRMNPAWVEWLMGFPLGWSNSED